MTSHQYSQIRNDLMEETPVSMGKIIHLQIINLQDKQWHSSGKGADVGSTFTLLPVSNQKSYVYLLELDFILDIHIEGKGDPLSLRAPGHNVFLSLLVISSPECGHHLSGHCKGGWQCSNEFERQMTLLMVQFKVSVRPWWPHVLRAALRSQNINLQELISHSIFFPNTG